MNAPSIPENKEGSVEFNYETPRQLEWVVRDDPQLQAELNDSSLQKGELSPKVVNRVLDRIRDL